MTEEHTYEQGYERGKQDGRSEMLNSFTYYTRYIDQLQRQVKDYEELLSHTASRYELRAALRYIKTVLNSARTALVHENTVLSQTVMPFIEEARASADRALEVTDNKY